jgi:ribosomal protein S18 acetylase RimI-like enzyme
MNNVIVRKAAAGDIDAIQRLYRQLDRHHVGLLPGVFQPLEDDARPGGFVAGFITNPDADYLVAEQDGTLLGFLSIQKRPNPPYPMFRPERYAVIDNILVEESCRGQGIGRALLEAAVAWAGEKGLGKLQATVWTANRDAKSFFQARGFAPLTEKLELDLGGEKHGNP